MTISPVYSGRPDTLREPVEQRVYELLDALLATAVPFICWPCLRTCLSVPQIFPKKSDLPA